MMNITLVKTIHGMSKQFSGSKAVNLQIEVRCFEAIRTKSMNGFCDPIKYVTIGSDFETVEYTMESDKVEARLKEIGLYQLVEKNSSKVTSQFEKNLNKLLLGSFGYAEVEGEIRKRAFEAVEQDNMEPLKQGVDMEWRNGSCLMSADAVEAKLKEKGIWQLVQSEISK